MNKSGKLPMVIFLALLILSSCSLFAATPAPDQISVRLKWTHGVQFAGFYIAEQKGYFAEENLSVNLLEGGREDLEVAMAGHQVELKISYLPDFRADPSLIKQVYLNLIDNAIKFSRGRDPARIEIGHLELEGDQIYFVKDNGVGFDMQYEDKLFGVFQRLHKTEDFEGTGVGLAIVLRIIRRHGGRIWAESEVDQGATFYFSLEGEIDNE